MHFAAQYMHLAVQLPPHYRCTPCEAGRYGYAGTEGVEEGRRRCAECEQGFQVQPKSGQTECIDCLSGIEGGHESVDCNVKDAIKVNPGFYRPEAANLHPNVSVLAAYDAMAVACPWVDACLGGTEYRVPV